MKTAWDFPGIPAQSNSLSQLVFLEGVSDFLMDYRRSRDSKTVLISYFLKRCHSHCPEAPTFHCPLNLCTLESLQRVGFSVATLEVLAVSWLPTKTITWEWKLSCGAHSWSRHLKGKVSNFLRIKKISFHNFQNILISSEIWKRFSLGSKPALFNVFLRYIYIFKNIEISLLNL